MDRITDIRQPFYRLFQEVRVVAELENRVMDDVGFITGFYLDPDSLPEPRWFYQVAFFTLPHEPWLRMPHLDGQVLESEIHPVEPLSESVAH